MVSYCNLGFPIFYDFYSVQFIIGELIEIHRPVAKILQFVSFCFKQPYLTYMIPFGHYQEKVNVEV